LLPLVAFAQGRKKKKAKKERKPMDSTKHIGFPSSYGQRKSPILLQTGLCRATGLPKV